MALAQNEVVIKSWDYAQAKQKGKKTTEKLEITNKRVIHTVEGKNDLSRDEIPLSSIKSVSYSDTIISNKLALCFILLGVLLAIVGIIVLVATEFEQFPAALICIVLGIILLVLGIKLWGQCAFSMTIYTDGIMPFNYGASKILKTAKKAGKVKIKIDVEAVKDIVDTFGAILIENK